MTKSFILRRRNKYENKTKREEGVSAFCADDAALRRFGRSGRSGNGEAVTATMFQAMQDALAEQKQNPLSIDDVTAMIAGQIGQLTPMDEETADLFKQLAKKMMKGIE